MFKNIADMKEYEFTLRWGLPSSELSALMEKHNKKAVYYKEGNIGICSLRVGDVLVHNFMGDCGTLYLSNANYAWDDDLAFIADYASLSGFSTIFATICEDDTADIVKRFKNRGWKEVHRSESNRNPGNKHHVMFLHIDCVYKGY